LLLIKNIPLHPLVFLIIIAVSFSTSGCATLSLEKQDEIGVMAAKAVAKLINQNPDLQTVFDNAAGYMVVDAKVTKIPVFGFGRGRLWS